MKRSSEYDSSDQNKKPRYSQQQQQSYNDMYSQYQAMNPTAAMMMNQQYAAATSGGNGFGGFASPNSMYGAMGYGVPGSNMFNGGGFGASGAGGGYSHPAAYGTMNAGNGQSNQHEISRTIYLGNVPNDIVASDIFDTVRCGAVESLKFLLEKNCAFLTFVEPASAQQYYQQYLATKLTINKQEIKVGWGKYTPRENTVQEALKRGGSRNVYIGQIDDSVTEDSLKMDCAKYGMIDQARILRDKNIAFVHFATIAAATKAVTLLPNEPNYKKRRVNYGKDRCAQQSFTSMPNQQMVGGDASQQVASSSQPDGAGQDDQYGGFGFQQQFRGFDPYGAQGYTAGAGGASGNNTALRTLYLGSIQPEATCEDLCNAIRGGVLFQIRYLPEKHIAFVTFVDPMSAMALYNHAQTNGLVVKGRRVKVGWGKPANIHSAVIMAVQSGASRNIYLGNMEEGIDEKKLRKDFEQYGEIELINTLPERNCAFVNFTNIQNAMKALASIKFHPDYRKFRINYGKDRCGNPFKPRTQQQQQHQQDNDNNNEDTGAGANADNGAEAGSKSKTPEADN
ncbi:hypothetical protein INT45_011754 [Circinella minor]|uniref:RRM domain-containing protein n=1 Tax=Circinella minor TaxID=1195481 RepID=A0A8H7SDB9_9FUNG|nr:hypothetical protein INT45_011754 [Circinella minor]